MEICCSQAIPVDVNTQARFIRCRCPPLCQQIAIRHTKLKGLLGHRRFEISGPFIGQHQVEVGDLGQRVIPALDLNRQSGIIGDYHKLKGFREPTDHRDVEPTWIMLTSWESFSS
jgi:hypothetical protein